MKSRIFFVSMLIMGLIVSFTPASMAALPTLAENVVVAAGTVAPNDIAVIGSYKLTSAAAGDAMTTFTLVKGGGTTAQATDLGPVSIYEDINANGSFEVGVDQSIGSITSALFAGGGSTVAYAYTAAANGEVKYILVVAPILKTGLTTASLDGAVVDCSLSVGGGAVLPTNDQTVAVGATHLQFNPAAFALAGGGAVLPGIMSGVGLADADILYAAVDDYGNIDKDIIEQTKLSIVDYNTTAATGAVLTATGNVAAVDYTAFGPSTVMVLGKTLVDVAAAAPGVNKVSNISINNPGTYVLIAETQITELKGSNGSL